MLRGIYLLLCVFTCLSSAFVRAESTASEAPNIQVSLINEENSIQAGRPFWVAVHLHLADKWHTYWKNPGDAGMATSIEWKLPPGFSASPLIWPTPQRFVVESIVGYGYEGEVLLLSQITPPNSLPNNQAAQSMELKADVRWLICSDSFCMPGDSELSLQLPFNNTAPQPSEQWADLFKLTRTQLPKKQQGLQAYRNQGLIELQLKLPNAKNAPLTDAYFCPEDKHVIDHNVEAVMTASPDSDGSYVIALQAAPSTEAKTLKGIVVVSGGQDLSKITHAIEVDASIIDMGRHDEVVSMTEQSGSLGIHSSQYEKASEPLLAAPSSEHFSGGLGMALLLAFVGGMILNLMPCVLPVISIKILSFVKMAGQSRALTLKHGAVFCLGVIVSFWVLAGILLIFRAYGQEVGWGFQLQEPLFVGILAAVLLVFGLSLFGVFELGSVVTNWAGQAQSRSSEGFTASFLSGVLATAVATPCTGPFLGSAIGFAITVPTAQAMLIFTFLGLGMASPYMVFACFPRLLRFLPKPGAWMETFKQLMGFLMLATVLWLLWVFGAQTGSLGISLMLAAFFCFALGCWIYGRWGSPTSARASRLISAAMAAICCVAGGYILITAAALESTTLDGNPHSNNGQITAWEEFSPERVKELRRQGTPVLIDFTAKWCLICQANHIVLSSKAVDAKLAELGVVKMKADWTKSDPVITEELRKHGRNGVPLYLLYGSEPAEPPKTLPQVLTQDVVLQQLADLE